MKVDELDMAILSELSNDASISIPKLAQKIKTNPSVAYSRIKRLTKNRMIEQFTIVVNEAALGYAVKTITGINMNTKKRDTVIKELMGIGGVREMTEVTGRFDILVTTYARDLDDMHELVSRIGKIDGVTSSESFVEMKSHTKRMPYAPQGGR